MTEKKLISEPAVLKRVRRKLRAEGQFLKQSTGGPYTERMGAYWVLSATSGGFEWGFDDLEATARELGCLKSWEAIAKPQLA